MHNHIQQSRDQRLMKLRYLIIDQANLVAKAEHFVKVISEGTIDWKKPLCLEFYTEIINNLVLG